LLLVVPRTTDPLSVLSYVLIDLHWWWGGALVLWMLFRLSVRLGGALRPAATGLVASMPAWVADAALVAIAGTWVIAGTPTLRFAIRPGGDLAMPGRIRACYVEANDGRSPAETDVGHYLYQWREERVAASEIRRRIFWGAGRQPPEESTARK
jgi:hypothetical protein